ncbi:MAG: YIP1 family protein [Acidobacteriota bacterium]
MASLQDRMIGAAMLNVSTYEEVEADQSALGQAMTVVIISSLAAGIGSIRSGGVTGLVLTTVLALVGWFIWAGLSFIIGTKLLPEPQTRSDMGELLRTIGFASSPGVLRIFGFIPILGGLISFVASLWMLAATVIAVRQALDYQSTGRAVAVCVIGFLVYMMVAVVLGGMIAGVSILGGAVG